MSGRELLFPIDPPYCRDLSDPALWERSLRRSVHRREIAELSRKYARRRKATAVAVSTAVATGPTAAPLAAVASASQGPRPAVAAPSRSAIHLPAGALVSEGDTGAAVAAVQRRVGVDDDGIFGPITRAGVERFQSRYGLPVTGEVDARTWTALFRSNVSFVGGGGTRVMTAFDPAKQSAPRRTAVYDDTGSAAPAAPKQTAPAPGAPRSTTPAPSTPRTTAPAPAPAPVTGPTTGGCGAGRIATPVSGTVTGRFGEARPGHTHTGEDISAPAGTPVRAAQCGTVTQAGFESGGYGNLVCIQHAGGVSTCYAHLSAIDTTRGAYVHVGDVIGRVGCTGSCTGPHLHFEVRENSHAVDPEPYLAGSKSIQGTSGGGTNATATTARSSSPQPSAGMTQDQPEQAQSAQAQSAPAQPAPAEPAPAQSAPAEPAPAQPAPAESAPAESAPAESAPAQSAPAESAPAESAPAESAPAQSAPAESAPAQSAPVQTAPAASAPTETTPAATAPTQSAPAPARSAPAAPAPAQTTPAASAPAAPTQSTPAPAESAPAAPAPAQSAPAAAAAPTATAAQSAQPAESAAADEAPQPAVAVSA